MTQPKPGEQPPENPPPENPPPPPPPPKEEDPPEEWDKDRAASTIKAQREAEKALKAELKASKDRLDALEKADKERQDAELSEKERLEKRVKELEEADATKTQALREARLKAEVTKFAVAQKAVDPDVVYRLLDHEELFDDKGEPTGVEEAVKALLKEKPFLATSTETPPTRKSGPPPAPSANGKGADEETMKAASDKTRQFSHRNF